jgi:hypothetical protein
MATNIVYSTINGIARKALLNAQDQETIAKENREHKKTRYAFLEELMKDTTDFV